MFLTKLVVSAFRPDEWVVEKPLTWFCPDYNRIAVPTGFVTNLASIPWMFRGILNVNGASRRAAVLHDWLYCCKKFPRVEADRLFYKALRAEGMGYLEAQIYWAGVRAGGWLPFGKSSGLTLDDFDGVENFLQAKEGLEDF